MALPVERLNAKFEGEFRFKGRVHGVPFALPGDLVQFQMERYGNRRRLKVLHIERSEPPPAALRLAEPFCPYFARCGGCRGQHLEYDQQLKLKAGAVADQMQARFGVRPGIRPAPVDRGYRNRMDFVIDRAETDDASATGDPTDAAAKREAIRMGLRGAGDYRNIIDLESCKLQSPAGEAALHMLRELLQRHPGAVRSRERGEGALKYATLRFSPGGAGLIVLTVAAGSEDDPDYAAFRGALLAMLQASEANDSNLAALAGCGLVECSNAPETEDSNVPGGRALLGDGSFRAELGGRAYRVPYDAFFQPNPQAFELILAEARELLERHAPGTGLKKNETLIDLFCGAGVLASIVCAWNPGRFGRVRGYEFVESAAERAPRSFADAPGGVTPEETEFFAVDLNRPPEDLLAGAENGIVVADPPRAGLGGGVRKALRKSQAHTLLYISCNPWSQLDDLTELTREDGKGLPFQVRGAAVVDCYPQTPHLEQVVLLQREPAPA